MSHIAAVFWDTIMLYELLVYNYKEISLHFEQLLGFLISKITDIWWNLKNRNIDCSWIRVISVILRPEKVCFSFAKHVLKSIQYIQQKHTVKLANNLANKFAEKLYAFGLNNQIQFVLKNWYFGFVLPEVSRNYLLKFVIWYIKDMKNS